MVGAREGWKDSRDPVSTVLGEESRQSSRPRISQLKSHPRAAIGNVSERGCRLRGAGGSESRNGRDCGELARLGATGFIPGAIWPTSIEPEGRNSRRCRCDITGDQVKARATKTMAAVPQAHWVEPWNVPRKSYKLRTPA
jgi:hypothetical protein